MNYGVSCGQTHRMIKQLLNESGHDYPLRLRLAGQNGGRFARWHSLSHTFIGELIHEDNIVIGGKGSTGVSIKGHYPAKNGLFEDLLAAETAAARNGGSDLRGIRIS